MTSFLIKQRLRSRREFLSNVSSRFELSEYFPTQSVEQKSRLSLLTIQSPQRGLKQVSHRETAGRSG